MELHIVSEANRCLNCKKPVCQQGCPIHTPIPQVIQLFKQGKLTEAGQILFENNPLSAICALICNHEQQCAGHCVLGKKSTPVHFSSIENYISEMYLDRMTLPKPEPKGKKVAVIGAGPAGIAAAITLAAQGYGVTIFEWHSQIGGIMRYGIPEFRLPKSLLERYQKMLEAMGIQIRLNTTIGTVLLIDNLFRDGYASVFIGTGAEKPRCLGIQGESLGNVHFGLNYLANPAAHRLGERVLSSAWVTLPWTWREPRCATAPGTSCSSAGTTVLPPAPTRWLTPNWTARSSSSPSRFTISRKKAPCSRTPSWMKTAMSPARKPWCTLWRVRKQRRRR